MDAFPVEICPFTLDGCEHLICTWHINNALHNVVAVFQTYTDGALVDAARIVGSAVNGVDYPSIVSSELMTVFLFAKES